MSVSPAKIAVVIPYFQRKRGLLRQCVRSVLENAEGLEIEVLVVDDGSPLPAEEEIGDFLEDCPVEVIHQENAGPAAARNMGLEHVAPGTRYVAFLDSDDEWIGPFLEDAVRALDQGFDLFVGNSRRTGIPTSRFQWSDARSDNIRPEEHHLVDPAHDLYEYVGDFFDLLVRRSNIIGPTTMAYRLDRFPEVRFRESLFQGEDRLFKLTLGQSLGRVAFSPRIYAEEGEGVNIFDKSGWKTEGYLRLTSNYISLSRMVLEEIRLDPKQRAFVRGQLADSRRAFVAAVLHQLRHRKPLDWSQVRATLRRDPAGAALFLPNTLRLATRRLGGGRRRPAG
ncbi:glycosyltransferase family 2 protein [Thioalkalivibrio sp. AKL10]|uniref:glycosyltransferase family 2 protein n=1 Tax=Thioalkalivibrio sp. AKL10 TaxID=1158158 RepID=UPI000475F94F|nr:glycosyltransferase family 2 protein [Thioalkalivibrio sp. AKL10]